MYPYQFAFEVHASTYAGRGAVTLSRHRSPKAAGRSLASTIRNVRSLKEARVWCARDNNSYSLERLRELIADGYFDAPCFK